MKRLYVDLDGVVADFDRYFPELFGVDHRGLADADLWKHINSHPSCWLDMPLFEGALEFMAQIAHLDPIILTACPASAYQNTARQKRTWCRNHFHEWDPIILPVMGGANKPLFMHAYGDVLVDDMQKNIDAWNAEGGYGILHKDFPTTLAQIAEIFGPLPALPAAGTLIWSKIKTGARDTGRQAYILECSAPGGVEVGSVIWWDSGGPFYAHVSAGRSGAMVSIKAGKRWVEENWQAEEIVYPHEREHSPVASS